MTTFFPLANLLFDKYSQLVSLDCLGHPNTILTIKLQWRLLPCAQGYMLVLAQGAYTRGPIFITHLIHN